MKKLNKTQLLPLALLVYLAFMAYVGYPHLRAGETTYYFGVIGVSLIIIILLYIVLRKREKVRAKRDEKLASTYNKDNNDDNEKNEAKD